MDVWQWTLTKEAIAPCLVRDVLDMRQSSDPDTDFFWLGYTPCRTVLLVGMVVAIQMYDKRAIYTVDDGSAVIDCVLRHTTKTRSPPRTTTEKAAQRLSPSKRLEKVKAASMAPPPPLTEPGYPVRVVGRVVRHYETKQIYASSIDPCTSSLDEIAHSERVIELHKTKYSLPIPFVLPHKPPLPVCPPDISTSHTSTDRTVFSDPLRARPTASYTLPAPPPRMPMPLQHRNRPPSSPTASSVASSTPSSPCKPSSPVKLDGVQEKPKLRHPSRLHTRDLTANTFRLYVKHYMDNAPPPFPFPSLSPLPWSPCGNTTTPRKRGRPGVIDSEADEATPRPSHSRAGEMDSNEHSKDDPTLGFTLSHLRRVPELALLASRVVRAETRKRDKAERLKMRSTSDTSSVPESSRQNGRGAAMESTRKKMKRLFSWAVVKLYEEGSIVLWEGEVMPLPIPPPPVGEDGDVNTSGLWNDRTNTLGSVRSSMVSTCAPTSALYDLSASASLYSHYHAPRRRDERPEPDDDADPSALSDPGVDEEAYVPLNLQFLAGYVREALGVLRRGRAAARGRGGTKPVMAEDVLRCMQRTDGRWARVGVWAVEEALAMLKEG